MSFLPKMCPFFFFFPPSTLSLSLSPLRNQCLRLCTLIWPLMTVNLYLFLDEQQRAPDTISHQNKRAGPVWTLPDTRAPNVAGRVSGGPLIRAGDSRSCRARASARRFSSAPAQGPEESHRPGGRTRIRPRSFSVPKTVLSAEVFDSKTYFRQGKARQVYLYRTFQQQGDSKCFTQLQDTQIQ